MTCDCCRRLRINITAALFGLPAICRECLDFAIVSGLPLSSVCDFIELCRDIDPGNL